MKTDPGEPELAINPPLVEEILVRFIRNEITPHRISPRRAGPVRRHRFERRGLSGRSRRWGPRTCWP